jgi:hypothetical protein
VTSLAPLPPVRNLWLAAAVGTTFNLAASGLSFNLPAAPATTFNLSASQ